MSSLNAKPAAAVTMPPRSLAQRLRHQPIVYRTVKPRLRRAIEAMVFEGLDRRAAAHAVGLRDITLYKAFKHPHVLKYYRDQLDVLRNSELARNLHVGIALRNASESDKVKLEAAKWLHGESDRANGPGVQIGVAVNVQPGYMVDVSKHSAEASHYLRVSGSVKTIEQDQ
jgi:hypothetical protein